MTVVGARAGWLPLFFGAPHEPGAETQETEAEGGEVEDPSDTYEVPMKEREQYMSDEGADTDQHESGERMTRDAGHKFAAAVKRARR